MHRTGHDVQHTAHRVRPIEHRGRASQHLYAVGHQRLVTVADGMPIDSVILRMAVNQHQHLPRATRQATQVDTTRRTRRYAVAHHRARGHHQPRHLLHHRGQYARLLLFRQRLPHDDVHRIGQMAHVNGVARSRHHHFLQRKRVCLCCTKGARSHENHEHRKQSFHSNTLFSPLMIYVPFVRPSRLAAFVSSFLPSRE